MMSRGHVVKNQAQANTWARATDKGHVQLEVEQMLQQQQGQVHHTTVPKNREVVMRGTQETVKTGCRSVYFFILGSLSCPTANNRC